MPIQCEYYALEGLGSSCATSPSSSRTSTRAEAVGHRDDDVRSRTKLSEQVVHEVQRYFGDLVYDVIIPRTVRLSEAPGFGQPITTTTPSRRARRRTASSRGGRARPPPDTPMPTFDEIPSRWRWSRSLRRQRSGARRGGGRGGPRGERRPRGDPRPGADRGSAGCVRRASMAPDETDRGPVEAAADAEVVLVASSAASLRSRRRSSRARARRRRPLGGGSTRARAPGEAPSRPRRPVSCRTARRGDRRASGHRHRGRPGGRRRRPGRRSGMADIGATLDDEKGRKRRWRMFRKGGEG